MSRLVVTSFARGDRDEILRYLSREAGPGVARKFAERFRQCALNLLEMPAYGPLRPELGRDCRVVIVVPYLLIYDHNPKTNEVVLLRILHGKRNITEKLLRR